MKNRFLSFLRHLLGIVIILGAIGYAVFFTKDSTIIWGVIHYPSLLLIMLSMLGSLLNLMKTSQILDTLKNLILDSSSIAQKKISYCESIMPQMCASFYRNDREKVKEFIDNPSLPYIWKKIWEQVEAKVPLTDIISLVNFELANIKYDYYCKTKVFKTMSALAPSLGMLGTILGLIKLLANLKDFASIGPNMSLALMTTLYGIFFSSIVIIPILTKLNFLKESEVKTYQQALRWLNNMNEKKPAFYLLQNYRQTKRKN